MRYILLLITLGFAVTFTSCRDDFEFENSTGGLEFSKDTVYLDTVFTNIGSSTYTLKVYNRSNKDIKIPSIALGEGENSKYRLMVDGVPGKVFNDVQLLAKDSMFVFVETTIDYSEYANNSTTFLYTDNIQFTSTTGTQKVELVTLVQDAVFIKPNRPLPTDMKETLTINGTPSDIQGHELSTADELHWTNQKPYVVYGYALVPNGKTLTVDAGARVHFHAESGLLIDNDGELKVNGTASSTDALENEVIFEGDRLEPDFADITGQWLGVVIMSNNNNAINHLTLKNATVGLLVQPINLLATEVDLNNPITSPKLDITNSQIYNCANFGILARAAVISGNNVVANNAGQAAIGMTLGGVYNFKQCTFSNYFNSYNQVPVAINDYADVNTSEGVKRIATDLTANFDNCIMYGSGNLGVSLERVSTDEEGYTYKTSFNHCFIKMVDYSNQLKTLPLYPFDGNDTNQAFYDEKTREILAKNTTTYKPEFVDPSINNLNISATSAAVANGDAAVAGQVPVDLNGQSRTGSPDIGAYQHLVE